MSIAPLARLLERVGAQGEGLLAYLGGLGYLALDTLKFMVLGVAVRPRIKTGETFFQMVRLGVRAIPIVVLVQTFVGMILAFQLAPVLADYGQEGKVGTVVAIAIFRELGPLISAIVLTGFAGAAIAAILMTISLTIIADIAGTAGGGIVDHYILRRDSWEYFHTVIASLEVKDFLTGLIKSGVFAFILVLISCYEGLGVAGGAGGVGRATTRSVVLSIFTIVAADCAFTAAFYFFW